MHRIVVVSVATWLALCCTHVPGAEPTDPQGIINRAIDAAGGKKVLTAHRKLKWQTKGMYYGMGDGLPYTGKNAVSWPGKIRMEVVGQFTIVLNGNQGWLHSAGATQPMTEAQVAQQKEVHYAGWVTTLLPLVEEKGFSFKLVEKATVDERPAVGVRVSSKDHQDVTLYFDEQSGLLVKSVTSVKAPEQDFKEIKAETWYRDYRQVGELKTPMKLVTHRDGKLFVEGENSEIETVEKFDANVFAEP